MVKLFLIIIFIGGLRTSIARWKETYKGLIDLGKLKSRSFRAEDWELCDCYACKKLFADDAEYYQRLAMHKQIKESSKIVFDYLFFTFFISGITVISLIIYINLIINF